MVNLLIGTKQTAGIATIAFSNDGKLFAAASDKGDVMVWTVGAWPSPKTVLQQRGAGKDLTFSGTMLGFASEDEALLYNVVTAEVTVLASKTDPMGSFTAISFTRDGKIGCGFQPP